MMKARYSESLVASFRGILPLVIIWLVIVLPAVCIELYDSFGSVDGFFSFSFDRELIAQGEWWRLFLGNFDHLSWSHLMLNAVFLAVLLLTFSGASSVLLIIALMCVYSLGNGLLIWFFSEKLDIYVGLSGSLYSLLVFGLLRDSSYPIWMRGLVYLGLLIKVLYEYFYGASAQVSELIGGPVATDVHVYGVILGTLSVIGLKLFKL